MANRMWGVAVLAGLAWAQVPSVNAGDPPLPSGTAPFQSTAGQYTATSQIGVASLPPRQPSQRAGSPGAVASFAQPAPGQWPAPAAPAANGVVRLPTTAFAGANGPEAIAAPPPVVNGTFRDDGDYVTITVDGKEVKLAKPRSAAMTTIPGALPAPEGTVRGRLMQNRRPLANCRVVIVPLEADGRGYRYDANREPLSSCTDNEGIYHFEHVPLGKYKLTWLPDGTNQWIRRVSIKPDVVINGGGEAVTVNTIGGAQQTIN